MKRVLDAALWLAVGAALLTLSHLALAPRLFFSSDTGLRYIQIQNLLANHFTSFAIRYAPPGLDGDPLQAPYYWARSLIDGEIYLHISSLFPVAAAAAFGALGVIGLALVPALGSLATGGAVAAMAKLCGLPRARWIGIASIVATPLLFYAIVLWDHSVVTALATWGIYGVAHGVVRQNPRSLLAGGAAVGLATTQRPEFGALALALAAAMLIHTRRSGLRSTLLTAAGGLLGALPLWILQQMWVGNFLGMAVAPHLVGYGDTPEFGIERVAWLTKVWRFFFYVEPGAAAAPWAFALAAGGMAALSFELSRSSVPGFSRSSARSSGVLGAGFGAMLCGYLLLAGLGWDHAVIGLAASFPLFPLVVAATRGPGQPATGGTGSTRTALALVRDTALLFVAFVVLAWPFYGGLQWGARYLLPAYPLLCLSAADGFGSLRAATEPSERRVLTWGSVALLALALILQGVGVHRRFAASEDLADTRRALREMSVQLVATDRYFLPSLLASMTPEVVFLDVVGDEEIRALLPKAAAAGISRIAVVSRPDRIVQLPSVIDGFRVVTTPGNDGRTLVELAPE